MLLAALALASGCARALDVGSEPGPVYRIVVHNDLAEAMIVTSNHAGGEGMLGAVPAGRSDTFVLARPVAMDIEIRARNSAGTRAVGPFPVRLHATDPVTIRLR
jgi:hypothetical protein